MDAAEELALAAVADRLGFPPGVHLLSQKSIETLRRAKEKADAVAARHVKRGS